MIAYEGVWQRFEAWNIIYLPLQEEEVEWQQEVEELQDIRPRILAEELPQVIAKSRALRTVSARGSLGKI